MLQLFKRKTKIPFIYGHKIPLIKVELLGKDILLIVDSGSDLCYIDKEFFDLVGYQGEIKSSRSVIGANGESLSYGRIETFIYTTTSRHSLAMTIFPLKAQFLSFGNIPEERPVGILGADFLSSYNALIDFNKQILYL